MARVNVQLNYAVAGLADRIARECKGEFFGALPTGGVQFGFATTNHAKLFANRVNKELKITTSIIS